MNELGAIAVYIEGLTTVCGDNGLQNIPSTFQVYFASTERFLQL